MSSTTTTRTSRAVSAVALSLVAACLAGWGLFSFAGRPASVSASEPAGDPAALTPSSAVGECSLQGGSSGVPDLAAPGRATNHADPDALAALTELREWAERDPVAALSRARAAAAQWRLAALVAALEGAAAQPSVALQLARELWRDEPALAVDCGTALLGALIRRGAFETALDLAQDEPAGSRGDWLAQLFGAWAEREPAFARELAGHCATQGIEGPAFDQIIERWAAGDPQGAATFSLQLPPGPARLAAVRASLTRWGARDPEALVALVSLLTDTAERDVACTALVCGTDSLNRPIDTALAWAESIVDPSLRERSLAHVIQEWANHDLATAELYVAVHPQLSAPERARLRVSLRQPNPGNDT